MSIIVPSASALGTPIPWHIEVTGPDVCATLPVGVLVNNAVFRISPKCACDVGTRPSAPSSKTAKQLNRISQQPAGRLNLSDIAAVHTSRIGGRLPTYRFGTRKSAMMTSAPAGKVCSYDNEKPDRYAAAICISVRPDGLLLFCWRKLPPIRAAKGRNGPPTLSGCHEIFVERYFLFFLAVFFVFFAFFAFFAMFASVVPKVGSMQVDNRRAYIQLQI
jgi:hypothetical protein